MAISSLWSSRPRILGQNSVSPPVHQLTHLQDRLRIHLRSGMIRSCFLTSPSLRTGSHFSAPATRNSCFSTPVSFNLNSVQSALQASSAPGRGCTWVTGYFAKCKDKLQTASYIPRCPACLAPAPTSIMNNGIGDLGLAVCDVLFLWIKWLRVLA